MSQQARKGRDQLRSLFYCFKMINFAKKREKTCVNETKDLSWYYQNEKTKQDDTNNQSTDRAQTHSRI